MNHPAPAPFFPDTSASIREPLHPAAFDYRDPVAVDAARVGTAAKQRELQASIARFGEHQRLKEAVDAATSNGREVGYRIGYTAGVRWGLFAGAIGGGLTVGSLLWLVYATFTVLGVKL